MNELPPEITSAIEALQYAAGQKRQDGTYLDSDCRLTAAVCGLQAYARAAIEAAHGITKDTQ